MEDLTFKPAAALAPGTLFSMLRRCYDPLWNPEMAKNMAAFDKEVFERPCVGACTFVSCLEDGRVVGFASYDPRKAPESAEIGHNCVLPEFQRRAFGKRQVMEVLRRFREKGIRKACVSTGEDPFFLPAQRMYLACGFHEVKRRKDGRDPRFGSIFYERELLSAGEKGERR